MTRRLHGWGARLGACTLTLLMILLAACGTGAATQAPVSLTPTGAIAGGINTATTTTTTTAATRVQANTTAAGTAGAGAATGPAKEVKVGVVLSLTGDAQVYGTTQRNGIQLAVDEINSGNFIPGIRLVPVIEDDASKKDQGITAFEKLIRTDNVIGIIGPTLSNTAVSTNQSAQAAGVPVLGVSNTAGGIVEIGNFIFRDSLSEAQVIPNTVRVAKEKRNLRRVAIIYGNDDAFTKAGYEVFKQALRDNGIQVTTEQTYAKGDTDFSAQLTEIKGTNPDAIVASSLANEGTQILVQARQLGINAPVIGGNGFNSPAVIQNGGAAAEGLIVGAAWNPNNDTPENRKFIEAYRARFGGAQPDQFAAQAYAGVYIMAEAMKAAGPNVDRRSLRDALAGLKGVPTVLGPFGFKDNRDADHPPVVQVVQGAKFDVLR